MSNVQATITLPPSLVGSADAARLIRELEALDATITAQEVRKLQVDASRVTQTMADVAAVNALDLTVRDHRVSLKQQLKLLKGKAPIVHVIFAEQPDPTFMAQIVEWARRELHPRSLLHTGLQPGIIAGCIVRTPSHIYDFSIGSVLKAKRDILTRLIKERTPEEMTAEQQAIAATNQALDAVIAQPEQLVPQEQPAAPAPAAAAPVEPVEPDADSPAAIMAKEAQQP
ncbi:MAG TPA: hypothetical protein VD735_00155 [Candidatus Saccharimonadales bacterium]|nr:hypothetical protein [Candidatus Saccharimonadales bacterium]